MTCLLARTILFPVLTARARPQCIECYREHVCYGSARHGLDMFANRHRSSVPSANDVLIPETLLKKRKADAKLREENQAKALELRKVCTWSDGSLRLLA